MTAAPAPKIAEEDRLRADLYNFLGVILSGPPDEMLLAQTASLSGDATPLGEAISTLAKMAHGLARAENVFEPEDNIASLMEMMGALIVGRFSSPASLEAQKTFFNKHIASWAGHFFSDLENAKGSVFYAPVGTIGRTFMEIEAEAFRLG